MAPPSQVGSCKVHSGSNLDLVGEGGRADFNTSSLKNVEAESATTSIRYFALFCGGLSLPSKGKVGSAAEYLKQRHCCFLTPLHTHHKDKEHASVFYSFSDSDTVFAANFKSK